MEKDKSKKKAKDIAKKFGYSALVTLEKSEIIALLKERDKEHETEKKELLIALSLKDNTIAELELKLKVYERQFNNKDKYSGYKAEWGGIEKVIYILKENGKPMLSNEIEKTILELQPKLKHEWKDTRGNTLRYITRAVKTGRVVKYYIGNGFTYGLPDWFVDGILIKKYNIT